jgi:Dienelactone hydrolase family
MDGFGIRPAMWEMGQRLADGGYLVLLPDLYYRLGSYPPKVPSEVLADPTLMEELMKSVGSLNRDRKVSDAGAFIDFLSARSDVRGNRFGATGYCMGGNASLTAAGGFPARFAAVASFHGGGLAAEDPDSPHRFLKGGHRTGLCRRRRRGPVLPGRTEDPPRKGFDRGGGGTCGGDLSQRIAWLRCSGFAGVQSNRCRTPLDCSDRIVFGRVCSQELSVARKDGFADPL